MNPWVVVGKVVSPRGVRGELKVAPLLDDPDFFSSFERVLVDRSEHGRVQLKVLEARQHDGMVLLLLDGIGSRNEAEAYRGADILVATSELPEPGEGRHYYYELEWLEVITNSGELLGVLDHIMETGSNDVYVVRGAGGREILIPAIRDVVVEIDPGRGRIVVEPMEGMLD